MAMGAHDGLWLGFASETFLTTLDERYYAGQGMYLDAGYNGAGLHEWERAQIAEHFPASGRIGVTAAGAGREVFGLLQLGYEVVGFEANVALAERGTELLQAAGHDVEVRCSVRDHWPGGEDRFDAVILGWGSYTLIASRNRRIALLRGVAGALPASGPVLISFFSRGAATTYHRSLHRVASVARRLQQREGPAVGDALSPNFVHYFDPEQLASEVAEAGFDLVTFAEKPYGHAILQKADGRNGTAVASLPTTCAANRA